MMALWNVMQFGRQSLGPKFRRNLLLIVCWYLINKLLMSQEVIS